MKTSRGLLFAALVLLGIGAILSGACTATPPAPTTLLPAQPPNQSPAISNVTANPPQIVVGQSTTITALASDPDDDPITYKWSASDGTITSNGSQITWTAPNKTGDFPVNLTVSDNRGGQTTGSVTIKVIPATTTVTLNAIPSQTGTVTQKNATLYGITKAGDDEKNVGYRAFWSFDISQLAGKEIESANLKFTTDRIIGYPLVYNTPPPGLGGLWLWKDTYGTSLPTFDYVGAKLINTGLMFEPPSIIDVTTDLTLPVSFNVTSFQVEALFNKVSNGNDAPDMIQWSSVVLEVTYANQ